MMHITPETKSQFPSMVVAAIANTCTHSCIHCQHRFYSKHDDYQEYYMKQRVFERIVNEIASYPESLLRICAWGEPCLHDKLIEFVDYAHRKKVRTVLLTNGYLLNSTLSESLMQAGLTMAEISIDAATEETFRKIRPSKDANAFRTVVENVEKMIALRNDEKYSTKIVVSFVVWPRADSENEFENFNLFWQNRADVAVKRRLTSFCGAIDPELIKIPEDRKPCYGLWARLNINPWGKVQLCYNLWERDKWILGDLNRSGISIASIWNSKEFKLLREQQIDGVFTGPCADCKDYNPYAWDHPFEEVFQKAMDKE
jgi:MoaA/NifB/PqqE/SkfB family radical SAM enzyme